MTTMVVRTDCVDNFFARARDAANKSVYACWHDTRVYQIRELHKQGLSHLVEAFNGCPWRTIQILKGN